MSGFAADWLALRAPADARARNAGVAAALTRAFAGRGPLIVLDLGAGTGNDMAATAPLLPGPQHWRLADSDPSLLARAGAPPGVSFETVEADLAAGLAPLLDPAPDLVAASALFDLVGAAWLDRFVAALAGRRLPLLAVLSYTGRESWAPAHPEDDAVLAAFHADQRRDKGLGPGLGPEAHACLAGALRAAGFAVTEGPSDWTLEAPRDAALIAALAEGTARAVAPAIGAERAEAWRAARTQARRVTVSHADLLALPPA